MKPLIISAEAETELDEAMTWYQQRRQGLELEFQNEVQSVLDRIRRSPARGWKHGEDGCRFVPLDRFPYLVIYEETADDLWVAAIAHNRRQPDYWRGRSRD